MGEVTIKRHFKANIERVFAYVSEAEKVLEWWGPDGMKVPSAHLDFSRPGPWHSEMHSPTGDVYKVSGQVTRVDPPSLIGFTWAWHDDNDARGHESHVMIELAVRDGGTDFVLTHRELANDESAANHNKGWISTISRLEAVFA